MHFPAVILTAVSGRSFQKRRLRRSEKCEDWVVWVRNDDIERRKCRRMDNGEISKFKECPVVRQGTAQCTSVAGVLGEKFCHIIYRT
jgi:hypothetical protein